MVGETVLVCWHGASPAAVSGASGFCGLAAEMSFGAVEKLVS